MENVLVAVYGTLRPGYGNHDRLLKNQSTHLGTTSYEGMAMISRGYFPAAFFKKGEKIVIDVFSVNNSVAKSLDNLEGYPHFYDRKIIDTEYGEAWVYFIQEHENDNPDDYIKDGDWSKFRKI